MSPRPGVEITTEAISGTRGETTASGVCFVVGMTEKGPNAPELVTSLQGFRDRYGSRVGYGLLYDWAETFFSEGGADLWVSRVVGPAPVRASLVLVDRAGAPINTLEVHARDVGDYANGASTGGLAVQVQDGTAADTFRLVITERQADGTYDEVESWDDLTMDPAAARYAPTVVGGIAAPNDGASRYVILEDLGSATVAPDDQPAVAARANLAGGTDDHINAADAHWLVALNLLGADLGQGQLAAPGRITTAGHQQLLDHGRTRNRTPLLDTGLGATEAAMVALAAAVDDYLGSDYAGVFGGHVIIPGLTGTTTRTTYPSAYVAGKIADLDARLGDAGHAPAGDQGQARFVLGVVDPIVGGVSTPLDDDAQDRLYAGRVNMVRAFRRRGVQLYGFQSVSSDPEWDQLNYSRERMSLEARLNEIALHYDFRTIDGRGQLFGELNGALVGELLRDYAANVLYGSSPEEAFRVDTSEVVNTPQTIQDQEIRAEVYARFAPHADLVRLGIFKVPVTGRV